jgi:hypothetical protein
MKQTRKLAVLGMISVLGLSFLTTGCARTLSRTEQTKVRSDGTMESKERTITENPDGTITKTEKRTTERP